MLQCPLKKIQSSRARKDPDDPFYCSRKEQAQAHRGKTGFHFKKPSLADAPQEGRSPSFTRSLDNLGPKSIADGQHGVSEAFPGV